MSEYEEEVAPLNEEQLQEVRDSTPEREEDSLDFSGPDEEAPLTSETPEESLLGTPVREEDSLVPEAAVEEPAETSTEESEHEVVGPEGAGADSQDHDPS